MQAENFTLDFENLRSLTGDDNEFMIEILELIVEQSPDVLTEMQTQLNSRDYITLGATAHKYKSSINILGNQELMFLMKELEDTATGNQETEKLVDLVGKFEHVCDLMLKELNNELAVLQSAN